MSSDKSDKFVLGVLIGGIIGYISGIFTAPEKGEKTIANMKKNAKKHAKDLKNKTIMPKLEEIKSKAKEKFDEAKGSAEDVNDHLKDKIDEVKEKIEETKEKQE